MKVRYCIYHEVVHTDKNHESKVCKIVIRQTKQKEPAIIPPSDREWSPYFEEVQQAI